MKTLDSHLVGCPVNDYATGQLLGWVKAVTIGVPPSTITGIVVDRQPDPAAQAIMPHFEFTETEPRPHQDYMIGQTATVTLHDPAGGFIVSEGETITCQVIHHARRCGLLHQLSATLRRQ